MTKRNRIIIYALSVFFFFVSLFFMTNPFITGRLGVIQYNGFEIVEHFFQSSSAPFVCYIIGFLYLIPVYHSLGGIIDIIVLVIKNDDFNKKAQKGTLYFSLVFRVILFLVQTIIIAILNFGILDIMGYRDNQLYKTGIGAIMTGIFSISAVILAFIGDVIPTLKAIRGDDNEELQNSQDNTDVIQTNNKTIVNEQKLENDIENVANQLKQLEYLKDEKLITEEEYQIKRKQILKI